MGKRYYINDDWEFTYSFEAGFADSETVCIPHSVCEMPYNYFDEGIYQTVSGYRKTLAVPKEFKGRHVKLVFEGVAHKSLVYINDEERASHSCGYTAFSVDITGIAEASETLEIVVKVDSHETLNQPPFGFVIDYMTFGGIYRDVYFEVGDKTRLEDVFLFATFEDGVVLNTRYEGVFEGAKNVIVKQYLNDKELTVLPGKDTKSLLAKVSDVKLWSIEEPVLYTVRTVLCDKEGNELDSVTNRFGFRKSEFRADGYYLNDKKVKIRGLNRHQSFAYKGYAMPASMQRQDADILKYELGLNAVRTSHYPQSHDFIERCDEIGLLVFTEMPGWQHIGDEAWKEQAIENTKDMVVQYRNHPSIILWGVRINESMDDDKFYKKTNEAAHRLDPTRHTGGVRNFKKSHLFEDVYTYNDFSHNGKTPGCDPKKKVTADTRKPYLISEYNGHMFPTKSFDDEEKKREHLLRHANVIDAVAQNTDIAGSFGWCMFDYNTHKDFGSGDRICYHGVMDIFRNPKPVALVYACEGIDPDERIILDVTSSMDIGEHPECCKGDVYILTNADSVRMYKNGSFLKEYFPKDSKYKSLKHGPILIDDYVGSAVSDNETYCPALKKDIKKIVNEVAMRGLSHMSARTLLLAAKAMLIHGLKYDEAVKLYNRYVGDWGNTSTVYTFEAIRNGKVVKTLTKAPTTGVHLELKVSHTKLIHSKSYDVASVRIRAVDDYGNTVSFYNEPIKLTTGGNIELIGPDVISLKGGMGAAYIKTKPLSDYERSEAYLTITNSQCQEETVTFTVQKEQL